MCLQNAQILIPRICERHCLLRVFVVMTQINNYTEIGVTIEAKIGVIEYALVLCCCDKIHETTNLKEEKVFGSCLHKFQRSTGTIVDRAETPMPERHNRNEYAHLLAARKPREKV